MFKNRANQAKKRFFNNFQRALAKYPRILLNMSQEFRNVIRLDNLDPFIKEMLEIAVSTAKGCSYSNYLHIAAAKAEGMNSLRHCQVWYLLGLQDE